MHHVPFDIPKHKTHSVKLMAVVNRLQQIMLNENLSPDELVGCAEIVKDNYNRFCSINNQKTGEIKAPNMPNPPPRRP
ncbi:hypothetical protein ACLETV_17595 [Citrobacter braakii]|uniref:hypothetical protein n=1 Tax=Citrobacter braakii TaxID=57706 RepID=UPI001D52507B|nr:hypothetical protein [Salmonella enterica subsp. enterica serovar Duesseldorf]HBM9294612.1 hypothetical protein [Citrobacter freundii]HBM9396163.1 hypothetical protein [Citrobacter freundii]HCC4521775.1 hypothetical protein [Citrobacter freundii]HEE0107706.1 hypothetical protein [Citrobacter gillenii]